MTVRKIAEAAGGELLCGDGDTPIVHISIDSRTMKGSALFVPLIGEKVDAHRFLKMALEAGANVSLTSEHDAEGAKELLGELWGSGKALIRVEDTKKALQQISERGYTTEYEDDYDEILCYGISFYKKRCMIRKSEK